MRPFTQHFCSNYTSQFTLGRASVPSVEEKVRQIIMDQLGLEASEVTPHTSFEDDLGADSRDLMEVVIRLEESFALEISDGEAEKIRTVQDAVDYIQRHAKSVQQ